MWQEIENSLYKRFEFTSFTEAFAFMTRVAGLAEQANHHPRWSNEWNVVEIWLTTHDAGDAITGKDHALALEIDKVAL